MDALAPSAAPQQPHYTTAHPSPDDALGPSGRETAIVRHLFAGRSSAPTTSEAVAPAAAGASPAPGGTESPFRPATSVGSWPDMSAQLRRSNGASPQQHQTQQPPNDGRHHQRPVSYTGHMSWSRLETDGI